MEFINFINNSTFAYFEWLCETQDTGAIVATAFDKLEMEPDFDVGEDMSYALKDTISEMLDEAVASLADSAPGLKTEFHQDSKGKPSWYAAVIDHEISQIHTDIVAMALLVKAGKWAPSKGTPYAE